MSEIKKELINSAQIQEFLEDFEKNSVTELLEEDSKEQNEIFEIAKARGIILKDRQCLAGFKTVYMFAERANLNKARVLKKDLLKGLPSLVGTPIDFDHQRQIICGAYIDYRYIVKDDSVIAYGVFYKNNFSEDWATVQKLFKTGKLTTSYEILSPKNKRVNLADGTFELHDIEIAGGALLLREKPAFPDAKVLSFAKINVDDNLVYASKAKCEDLIIHGTTPCMNCGKCEHKEVATEEKKIETPKIEVPKVAEVKVEEKVTPVAVAPVAPVAPVVPAPIVIPKIKCANCGHEFDAPKFATSEMKCSECFAIINDKGEILYPPQIIDFNISCPSCSSRNWRLLQKDEATGQIKCMSCAKKYSIGFEKVESNAVLNMIQFLHIGHVSCKQCGNYIEYSGTSQVTTYNLKCKKCGLAFVHDITKEQIKRLSKIEEIIEPIKASEEIPSKADELKIDISAIKEEAKGEVKMEQIPVENIVEVASTPDAKSEVAEVKVVIAETAIPVVAKEEAPKVEETPKVEEAKIEEPKTVTTSETTATIIEEAKVEVKIEVPVEAKIEETPKEEVAPIVEATVETPKVETPVEAKTEVVIEEDEYETEFEVAKKLTTEQRNALPDDDYAVVVEKDGKKIRKYPINDKAHVRNALARLGNAKNRAELEKLGVNVEEVIKKVERKAKSMNIAEVLAKKAEKVSRKKVSDKIKKMKKVVKASVEKIEFYKANAEEINKRRKELGDAGKNLSDEELIDNTKFSDAKLVQANLETSSIVGTKKTDEDNLNKYRKEIVDKAEGRIKRAK